MSQFDRIAAQNRTPSKMSIILTDFAIGRLFPKQPRGNTIQDCTAEEFERYLNEHAPLKRLERG